MTTYHYQVLSTDSCGHGPTHSTDATFTTGSASVDISGWILKQYNSTDTYTFPSGTTIPAGGYLVVGRTTRWPSSRPRTPTCPPATVYVNSNPNGSCTTGCFPVINGGETFELDDASSTLVDGITIALPRGGYAYQRIAPGDAAGSSSSWTTLAMTSAANPGQGAGTLSGEGVVINEIADATELRRRIHRTVSTTTGPPPPDTTPPAAITDLRATPLSTTSILLNWTATGNDGTTGTATAYDVRRAASRIPTSAQFNAATAVTSGVPTPAVAGPAQSMTVTGLTLNTAYYFSIKTRDARPQLVGDLQLRLRHHGPHATRPRRPTS